MPKQYIPTIGIECHVQLKTKTKLFSAVGNDAREAAPNTLISHICMGLPGALPVLNKEAIHLASKAAFALNTKPQSYSYFERKHYFYPDLPMGYQISQLDKPIVVGGSVDINIDGQVKTIRINRAQLEADAGKNTHPANASYSLVDLNRVSTPLLEIVSEPDMHSAEQAKAYVRELYLLMKYADVSDCDLYHGHMRFDVNVSLSKNPDEYGTRTETKNLNSFKAVEKAAEYEIKRQTELLEKGQTITQETRGWDDAKQKTVSQRSKEEAQDYRYMPEPDIPPVNLDDEYIQKIETEMPMMPASWRTKLESLGLEQAVIETLLDAEVENEQISYLSCIEQQLDNPELAKFLVNWYVNMLIPVAKENDFKLDEQKRMKLGIAIYELLQAKKLSSTSAKSLFTNLAAQDDLPADIEKYAKDQGFVQVSDEGEIAKIVAGIIAGNPKAAQDVKNGEMKAIGFLVGQVMKESKGKANPSIAQDLIKKELGI